MTDAPEKKTEEVVAAATDAAPAKVEVAAPAAVVSPTEVAAKVLRQIEYYFSDASYPFDDYIKGLCDEEGYVELTKLAAFPKLMKVTTEMTAITDALKGTDSLEVKDGKVRRKFPVPDVDPDKERTVHASGFAAIAGFEACTLKITEVMAKYGEVENVRVLRDLAKDERALDGSAFVRFKDVAGAKAATEKNGAVRDGRKISVYALVDWFDRQKKKKEAMAKKRGAKEERIAEDKKPATPLEIVRGAVMKFAGLEKSEASREDLKAACEKHGGAVKYVEFERGQAEGMVRFAEAGEATKVLALLVPEGKATLTICEVEATVTVLLGAEEDDYWQRAAEKAKASKRSLSNRKGGKGKGQKRGGGGGGRGGGAKRQRT